MNPDPQQNADLQALLSAMFDGQMTVAERRGWRICSATTRRPNRRTSTSAGPMPS